MHTQLKALPSPEQQYHHHQSNQAIQQLATTGYGQQGTIISKSNSYNNYHTKTIVANAANHHIPVAFVEFTDVQSAGRAMQMLQGKYLLSSDRGAIRIEYAKSSSSSSSLTTASFPYPFTATATAILNGRPH